MSHTYHSIHLHVVFAVTRRRPLIKKPWRDELWRYMRSIAKQNEFKALIVGGVEDHCYCLLALPPKLEPSKAVQLVKGGSSKWVRDRQLTRGFGWQEGYGVFSVGVSQIEDTIRYIKNQEVHHRRMTFEEEYVRFLEKHGIPYDERYLFEEKDSVVPPGLYDVGER